MQRRTERAPILWLGAFTIAVAAIRLSMAGSLGLAPDEAYYWQWSRDLSFTYLDHPPLVAWLVRAGVMLAGQNELGVRLHCVTLSLAAIFIVYKLARELGMETGYALLAACLSSIMPAPSSAGIIATPDTALGLSWLTAMLAAMRLSGENRSSHANWYIIGAALGFGLLAKHSALLIPVLVLIAAVISPKIKSDLKTFHPWLAAALAVLIALPYLVAEAKTGFKGFCFQASHLTGGLDAATTDGGPLAVATRLVDLVGGQIGLVTPLVAVAVVIAFIKKRKSRSFLLLAGGLLLPMAAAAVSSLFTHPEQNWASLGHPIAAIIAIIGMLGRATGGRSESLEGCSPVGRPMVKAWPIIVTLSVLIITAVIHVHALWPFLPLPPQKDPTSRLHGWQDLNQIAEYSDEVDAIVCDNYGLAAEAEWTLRDGGNVAVIESADREFGPPPGRWLILDQLGDWGEKKIEPPCGAVQSLQSVILKRPDGQTVRKVALSVGNNCKK